MRQHSGLRDSRGQWPLLLQTLFFLFQRRLWDISDTAFESIFAVTRGGVCRPALKGQ